MESRMRLKFDIEVREIAFCRPTQYSFTPLTSAGQDWLEDELELRGTGRPVRYMTVTGVKRRENTIHRMEADGLAVAMVHGESRPRQ